MPLHPGHRPRPRPKHRPFTLPPPPKYPNIRPRHSLLRRPSTINLDPDSLFTSDTNSCWPRLVSEVTTGRLVPTLNRILAPGSFGRGLGHDDRLNGYTTFNSPSVKSSFSADGKSTETGSIMSGASYGSYSYHTPPGPILGPGSFQPSFDPYVRKLSPPTQPPNMMPPNKMPTFRQQGSNAQTTAPVSNGMVSNVINGEIRCEICQVSVNSSNQLQAHIGGIIHDDD